MSSEGKKVEEVGARRASINQSLSNSTPSDVRTKRASEYNSIPPGRPAPGTWTTRERRRLARAMMELADLVDPPEEVEEE